MSWLTTIATGIEKAFQVARPALMPLPALLLICEAKNRPGLSAIALASAIIQRFPEIGIPSGVNPDGSPNLEAKKTKVWCQEIVRHLLENLKITVGIPPCGISVSGTVMTPVGPGTFTGCNPLPVSANGIGQ